MPKNLKLTLVLGFLALVAVFVLIIFARSAIDVSMQETLEQYDNLPVTTRGPLGEPSSDALVVKGNRVPPVRDSDPLLGPAEAALTIIEYADFQCPYCADMAPVLDQVLSAYPAVGLVWKDLANPLHLQARNAAVAARCAQEQDQFWGFHDLLFTNQERLGDDLYALLAAELGLATDQFKQCLNSQAYLAVVGQGLEEANDYDIDSTPYLFVGSARINRAVTFEELSRVVREELERQGQ